MRQHIFNEFDLILSPNIKDLFQWFGTDEIHGLLVSDAIKKDITSMVHYHPNDVSASLSFKPFIYLNNHTLSNIPIHESAIIISGASQRLSEILTEGFVQTKAKEVETFTENLSLEILDELNFPQVFHRL